MSPVSDTLQPTPHEPCTLHPAPCTLHPEPCTLHPEPCTLHPEHRTLRQEAIRASLSFPEAFVSPSGPRLTLASHLTLRISISYRHMYLDFILSYQVSLPTLYRTIPVQIVGHVGTSLGLAVRRDLFIAVASWGH